MKYREELEAATSLDPELFSQSIDYYRLKVTAKDILQMDVFTTVLRDQCRRVAEVIESKCRQIVSMLDQYQSKFSKDGSVPFPIDGATKKLSCLQRFVHINCLAVEKVLYMLKKRTTGRTDVVGAFPTSTEFVRMIESAWVPCWDKVLTAIATTSTSSNKLVEDVAPLDPSRVRSAAYMVPHDDITATSLHLAQAAEGIHLRYVKSVTYYDTQELTQYRKGLPAVGVYSSSSTLSIVSIGSDAIEIPTNKVTELFTGKWTPSEELRKASPQYQWDRVLSGIVSKGLFPCVTVRSENVEYKFPNNTYVVIQMAIQSLQLDFAKEVPTDAGTPWFRFPVSVVEVFSPKGSTSSVPLTISSICKCDEYCGFSAAVGVHYTDVIDNPPAWIGDSDAFVADLQTYHRRVGSLSPVRGGGGYFSDTGSEISGTDDGNMSDAGGDSRVGGLLGVPKKARRRRPSTDTAIQPKDPFTAANTRKVVLPKVRVRNPTVNAKTYFSNERTFLHWQHFAAAVCFLSFSMIITSKDVHTVAEMVNPYYYCGVVGTIVGMILLLYSLYMFYYRLRHMTEGDPTKYYDMFSPGIVSITVFCVVLTILIAGLVTGVGYRKGPLKSPEHFAFTTVATASDGVWDPIVHCLGGNSYLTPNRLVQLGKTLITFPRSLPVVSVVAAGLVLTSDGCVRNMSEMTTCISNLTACFPTVQSATAVAGSSAGEYLVVSGSSSDNAIAMYSTATQSCRVLSSTLFSKDGYVVESLSTMGLPKGSVGMVYSAGLASRKCVVQYAEGHVDAGDAECIQVPSDTTSVSWVNGTMTVTTPLRCYQDKIQKS